MRHVFDLPDMALAFSMGFVSSVLVVVLLIYIRFGNKVTITIKKTE